MNEVSFSRKVKEVKFGSWSLDPKRQTISDGEVERELEPLLFNILCYLIINNDQIITRQNLIEDVWCQGYVDDNAINRAMSELRKVLKSERQKGTVVKTHHRKGYSFFLEPSLIYHSTSAPSDISPIINEKTPGNVSQSTSRSKSLWLSKKPVLLFFSCLLLLILVALYFSKRTLPRATEQPLVEKLYSEKVLSWMNGKYNMLKLSPDKSHAAFSFTPIGKLKSTLVVKDLRSGQERRFAEADVNYFPMGWSIDGSHLFYRVLDIKNKSCEIWTISRDFETKNKPLFSCELRTIFGAEVAPNTFVYTKSNYRNRDELSALVSRNLVTGDEFQITSPNLNSFGDHFLHYENELDSVFFERRHFGYSELYMTGVDGGNLVKLHQSESRIWALSYNKANHSIIWMLPLQKVIIEYSLDKRAVVNRIKLTNDNYYSSYEALSLDKLLVVDYPFTHQIQGLDTQSLAHTIFPAVKNIYTASLPQDDGFFIIAAEVSDFVLYETNKEIENLTKRLVKSEHFIPKYQSETKTLLLQFKNHIEVYNTQTWKLLSSFDVQGTILSSSILSNGTIGYVVSQKNKNVASTYSIETGQTSTLPLQDVVWFSKLNENIYVYLSAKDKLTFFDINLGRVVEAIALPKAVTQHSIVVAEQHIYHSDGHSIYAIHYNDTVKIDKLHTVSERDVIKTLKYHKGILYFDLLQSKSNHLIELQLVDGSSSH
ncbi:transcriptional regulator [Pseudoalteromonas sp. J010]|uniref:winged helix-turn-helix domain-containing protein n=1 Tax=Pseudoalteromonas sp. J010 TaxID=998465 RepID=UPI000F64A9D5|nr:winged helix-turn-helix domain-containing protein [Pseudoalteromonas sp. J010]RRS06769.1 transcriptional regulator [Pseudoalteromonas sp. J010]